MLYAYVMSQVPWTSEYTIVNFICECLSGSWEVLEEWKGTIQELKKWGLCPIGPHSMFPWTSSSLALGA